MKRRIDNLSVRRAIFLVLLLTLLGLSACPAASPAGPPAAPRAALTVCSENLNRFGESRPASKRRARQQTSEEQLDSLVERMVQARCDVVAMQELSGSSKAAAQKIAGVLASALSARARRRFSAYVGESDDIAIRNGFLVADELGSNVEVRSFENEPLVKLAAYGPVGTFQRPPVGLYFTVRSAAGAAVPVFVLNLHFKSRSFGFKDVFHTGFETLRMEMAETTRRIFERERRRLGSGAIAVLLGDRNNEIGSATAEILSGEMRLEDFESNGPCRLDTKLQPECRGEVKRPNRLLPLLELQHERGANTASYRFRGRAELIDEILIPADLLPLVEDGRGGLRAGVTGEFRRGSDHKLVWAELSLSR